MLKKPKNENYAATVIRIGELHELPGLDNLKGVNVLGYQALTASDYKPGDLALAFTAETQLSEEYAKWNNLNRDAAKNADPEEKGYLDDNRRIKALKLRGHRSDALLMPLHSLYFAGPIGFRGLKEGDTFDEFNGVPICKKYVPANFKPQSGPTGKQVTAKQLIPKHFDTSNYFKNKHLLNPEKPVGVTQKLHGTSIRVGKIKRKPTKWERVKLFFGREVDLSQVVIGSRNLCYDLDQNNLWVREGKKIAEKLHIGEVVYGELIGWDGDKPIQKNYTYNVPKGESRFYAYRYTFDGQEYDPKFLLDDFSVVPVLWCGAPDKFHVENFMDVSYHRGRHLDTAIPVDKGMVDEGVCIRQEGVAQPLILKAKSPKFLQHETKMLDKNEIDLETVA